MTLVLTRGQGKSITASGTEGRTGAGTAVACAGSAGGVRINEVSSLAPGTHAAVGRTALDAIIDLVTIYADTANEDLVETVTAVRTSLRTAATEITHTGAIAKSRPRSTAETLSWLVVDAGQAGRLAAEDAGAVRVGRVAGDAGRTRGAVAAGETPGTAGDTPGPGKVEPIRTGSALSDISGVAARARRRTSSTGTVRCHKTVAA